MSTTRNEGTLTLQLMKGADPKIAEALKRSLRDGKPVKFTAWFRTVSHEQRLEMEWNGRFIADHFELVLDGRPAVESVGAEGQR